MDASVETRLRRLEDEREIAEALNLYGHHADTGEHGEREVWSGREEIRAYIDDPTMHMKIEGRCMHLAALNLRIEWDGEVATARRVRVAIGDTEHQGGPE